MGIGIVDSKSRNSWLPLWHRSRVKPRILSLIGAYRGAGTTFQSIAIANYLASKGYRTAVMEMKGTGEFEAIQAAYEGMGFSEGSDSFTIRRVTYFPFRESRQDMSIMAMAFDFIVQDWGTASGAMANLMGSDHPIVVCQGTVWKQPMLEDFALRYGSGITPRWTLLVSFADNDDMKRLRKAWTWETYKAPFVRDPFVIDEGIRRQYDAVLGR